MSTQQHSRLTLYWLLGCTATRPRYGRRGDATFLAPRWALVVDPYIFAAPGGDTLRSPFFRTGGHSPDWFRGGGHSSTSNLFRHVPFRVTSTPILNFGGIWYSCYYALTLLGTSCPSTGCSTKHAICMIKICMHCTPEDDAESPSCCCVSTRVDSQD